MVGLVIGLWFFYRIGPAFIPYLLFGAVFVLGYTDALARLGVGEVAAGLGLGGMAVSGVAIVQEGMLGDVALAASVPAFLMTFNLLLLNEYPDEAADREGGRRNLVLLLGRRTSALIYALAALLVPIWIVAVVVQGTFPVWALVGSSSIGPSGETSELGLRRHRIRCAHPCPGSQRHLESGYEYVVGDRAFCGLAGVEGVLREGCLPSRTEDTRGLRPDSSGKPAPAPASPRPAPMVSSRQEPDTIVVETPAFHWCLL